MCFIKKRKNLYGFLAVVAMLQLNSCGSKDSASSDTAVLELTPTRESVDLKRGVLSYKLQASNGQKEGFQWMSVADQSNTEWQPCTGDICTVRIPQSSKKFFFVNFDLQGNQVSDRVNIEELNGMPNPNSEDLPPPAQGEPQVQQNPSGHQPGMNPEMRPEIIADNLTGGIPLGSVSIVIPHEFDVLRYTTNQGAGLVQDYVSLQSTPFKDFVMLRTSPQYGQGQANAEPVSVQFGTTSPHKRTGELGSLRHSEPMLKTVYGDSRSFKYAPGDEAPGNRNLNTLRIGTDIDSGKNQADKFPSKYMEFNIFHNALDEQSKSRFFTRICKATVNRVLDVAEFLNEGLQRSEPGIHSRVIPGSIRICRVMLDIDRRGLQKEYFAGTYEIASPFSPVKHHFEVDFLFEADPRFGMTMLDFKRAIQDYAYRSIIPTDGMYSTQRRVR